MTSFPDKDHQRNETPDAEAVQGQLDRILSSPGFLAAPQRSSFLRYVVEETLAGRSSQIKQYTVAVRAFGRDPSFNPQIDNIVRIEARGLRRALRKYYESQGSNDPVCIDIPKGSYVPVFYQIATTLSTRSRLPSPQPPHQRRKMRRPCCRMVLQSPYCPLFSWEMSLNMLFWPTE